MKPSVFASFIVFLLIGFQTLRDYNFGTDPYVEGVLIVVIFSSAFYYYYLNVATEQNWAIKQRVPTKERITWWITALQYIGFLLLWHLLRENWRWYAIALLFLNLSYLLWDGLHFHLVRNDPKGVICWWDVAGAVLSVLLVIATYTLPPKYIADRDSAHHGMTIAIVGALLIVQALSGLIAAIVIFRYNPFQPLAMDGNPIRSKPIQLQSGESVAQGEKHEDK